MKREKRADLNSCQETVHHFGEVALFASGAGTNVCNLLNYAREFKGPFHLHFNCIVTDNPRAEVIQYGKEFNIPTLICPYHKGKEYEEDILAYLKAQNIHWAFLCGYMRIMGKKLLNYFYDCDLLQNRVINIHPSYLPEFPGLRSYERAFKSDQKSSGVSLHFVDEGIDTGKVIAQERFFKEEGDTLESFKKKGLELEHLLYKKIVKRISDYTGSCVEDKKGEIIWNN